MSPSHEPLPAVPESTTFDYALLAAKVAALAFPFVGSGVMLFDVLTAPARSKRLTDWCEELRERINEIAQKVEGLTPEALASNESFVSTFAHATQAALKTHQAEKRQALRNAVLNVALGKASLPSDDLQLMFVNMVDRFTPVHLQILHFFADRAGRARPNGPGALCDQAVEDLSAQGLIKDTRPYVARNRDATDLMFLHWEITSLGRQFLEFIEAPN